MFVENENLNPQDEDLTEQSLDENYSEDNETTEDENQETQEENQEKVENEVQVKDNTPKKETSSQQNVSNSTEDEAEMRGYRKGIIESLGGVNPYTNEKIEDDIDLNIYFKMKSLAEQGSADPKADFYKEFKRTQKEEIAKKQESENIQKKVDEDIRSFKEKNPDVDFEKLINDEDFLDYADGKLGNKPLTEIYDKYLNFTAKRDEKSRKNIKDKLVNEAARIDSSVADSESSSTGKTKVSYLDMSDEDFKKLLKREY